MLPRINWFGLVGAIITLMVVTASLYVPWWQISIGELGTLGFSPVRSGTEILGTTLTIPLVWTLNMVGLLLLITSGAIMFVYSLLPAKSYSKHLLNFAYKKPFYTIVFFVIILIATPLILQAIMNISIPITGTSKMSIPADFLGGGTSIDVLVSAGFLWTFWLAIVAAALCIAAKIYHRKVASAPENPIKKATANLTETPESPTKPSS